MSIPMQMLAGLAIGLVVGGGVAALVLWRVYKPRADAEYDRLKQEMAEFRTAAEREAQSIVAVAQQESRASRAEFDRVMQQRQADLARAEERIDGRQASLDKLTQRLELRDQVLNKRQSRLDKMKNELDSLEADRVVELQRIASMTTDEARQQLLATVETEARQDMARIMREIEDRARETAEESARELIALAIQRVASDHVADITVSVVPLPNEEMKGRIIGRNGRNIRAFETVAGVDVVVDDTPEAVTISSFDSVRREVARIALAKLITDGRIHPARIEKVVSDAQSEVDKQIKDAGEQAAYEANVHGLHPEVMRMLGRLKYRTSYGQNQLYHAVEASKIATVLAAELGANINVAKMGALLHDLGKAMDHDQEGTHAMLGAEFARRFGVPEPVVNAIASHHHEVDQESVEAIIVEAADAISGARPGARRESLENYIKRVRTLEDISLSFEGVESAYALQAGREIRIFVRPGMIDDLGAIRLSKDIARAIEDSMQYPGQIQVTVVRETRAVGFAK
jgi:ribonuclease Y